MYGKRRPTGVTITFQYSVLFLGASSQQSSTHRRTYYSFKGRLMMSIRTLALGFFVTYALVLMPARAAAQFTATPFSDPATGERYHIEVACAFWNLDPHFLIRRESRWLSGASFV